MRLPETDFVTVQSCPDQTRAPAYPRMTGKAHHAEGYLYSLRVSRSPGISVLSLTPRAAHEAKRGYAGALKQSQGFSKVR
jgi:hypothetical protein